MTTAAMGFWGKIPARGDFVAFGLSRGFVRAWDEWMSQALADSQTSLGSEWAAAWMEAPVWRFVAAPDVLGALAVAGLWMPSVDRAGRAFPLAFAAEFSGPVEADEAWLDAGEDLGRAALETGLSPDEIAGRLPAVSGGGGLPDPRGGSVWWSQGSPRVEPQQLIFAALPGPAAFARMIGGVEP